MAHPLTRTLCAALALAAAGCGRKPAEPAAAAAGAPGPAGAAAAAQASAEGFVTAVTALRRAPSEAARVPGPGGGKEISNFLGTLHRGEAVTVLEAGDEWVKVRSSGDTEGWLKRAAVLDGAGVTLATAADELDLFDRPELLAQNRKLAPGALLLVVKTRPPFSEVNVAGTSHAWVLADRLTSAGPQVEIAKLTEKARWQVKNGKRDAALETLDIARRHFAGEPLVDALALELGAVDAPAAEGAVVPTAGELPAPSAGAEPTRP